MPMLLSGDAQIGLAGKVMEQCALGYTGLRADLIDTGGRPALPRDQ